MSEIEQEMLKVLKDFVSVFAEEIEDGVDPSDPNDITMGYTLLYKARAVILKAEAK